MQNPAGVWLVFNFPRTTQQTSIHEATRDIFH